MPVLNRLLANLCLTDLAAGRDFFVRLFDLQVNFDSDWFVHLGLPDSPLELGLILRGHDLVPEGWRGQANGCYLTLVLDAVEPVLEKAREMGVKVVEEPQDTFYGQRRLLLEGPEGVLLDVSAPIPDFDFSGMG